MSGEEIPSEGRYPGSDELLGYIKKSIIRCTNIGTDKIFLDIFTEYKRGLEKYCAMLANHIPSNFVDSTSKNVTFTEEDIISACLIVNTAEYMSDILPELENRLKKV